MSAPDRELWLMGRARRGMLRELPPHRLSLVVDSEPAVLSTSTEETLARALRRDGLGHVLLGCRDGRCGSCRLLVDGEIVNSCMVDVQHVRDGAAIETADSLYDDRAGNAAVRAFDRERSTRCRLCVGALRVTAASLSRKGLLGDEAERERATEKAVCMCTGRESWRRALATAADEIARDVDDP